MSIRLTAEQERYIESKLQSGQYRSAEEVLETALRLLEEYERAETAWAEEVRAKIEAAIATSTRVPPLDGETFVNQILERFEQARSH